MKPGKTHGIYLCEFMILLALYLFLPLLFYPASNDYFNLPKILFFEAGSALAFSAAAAVCLLKNPLCAAFKKSFPLLALSVFFLFLCALSLFFAESLFAAFKGLLYFSCMAFLLFALLSQPGPALERLFAASVFSASAASFIAALQHFGYDITGISKLSGVPASFMAGTLGHRNYLAELVCVSIPPGFALYLGADKPRARLLVFSALCLMYLALLLTNSRSGMTAFFFAALFFCFVCGSSPCPPPRLRPLPLHLPS